MLTVLSQSLEVIFHFGVSFSHLKILLQHFIVLMQIALFGYFLTQGYYIFFNILSSGIIRDVLSVAAYSDSEENTCDGREWLEVGQR